MNTPAAQESFVHHVLFYPKADATAEDLVHLLEGLRHLASIPCIKLSHIGTPAATNRAVIERTYAYSWLCIFESAADEEVYQQHPIHDTFRNQYAVYWDKVVIYDATGSLRGSLPA